MLAITRISLVLLLTVAVVWPVRAQSGVRWTGDFTQARELARRDQRLILLHFYSDACPPCRMLEQNVFPNPQVSFAIAQDYVPVKVNGLRSRELVERYGVRQYPTDVILNADGRILYLTVSPKDPGGYTQMLTGLAAAHRVGRQVASRGGMPAQTAAYGEVANAASSQAASAMNSSATWTNARQSAAPFPQGTDQPGASRPVHEPSADDNSSSPRSKEGSAYSMPQSLSYGPRYADQYQSDEMPTERAPAAAPFTPSSTGNGQMFRNPTFNSGPTPPQERFAQAPTRPDRARESAFGGFSPTAAQPPQTPREPPAPRSNEPAGYAAASSTSYAMQPGVNAPSQGSSSTLAVPSDRADESPLALDGFCPVMLADREQWEKGDVRWGAVHRGRTYLFASLDNQQRFLIDPDRFSPILSGYDAVAFTERGQLVPGNRRHGMWFRGSMYLFADEASLERFNSSPEVYSQKSREIMMSSGR